MCIWFKGWKENWSGFKNKITVKIIWKLSKLGVELGVGPLKRF